MIRLPSAAIAVVGVAVLAFGAPSNSRAQFDAAERIQRLIVGLDFDEARRALAAADADDPRIALERARLSIYELDCDGAAVILERSEVQKAEGGSVLGDIARGCQRVTAALAIDKDDARNIEIRWQDEEDAPLAPLLFDAVAKARDTISQDLGVDWPRPTRIVVVRDLLSLSAMTGLPYQSAQTTGTVGVAKWGRITLLSPRASRHGYPWLDTVAHELTHLAVTRASRDRAPLWLQEGVAKREEVRWRAPGPFDGTPPADAVAKRGIELGLALPLDRMGPSLAMLPSPDAAMVAFAEVTSFVRFYNENAGERALPKLMSSLRDEADPNRALAAASGSDLRTWDGRWRAYVAAIPSVPLSRLLGVATKRPAPGGPKASDEGATEKRSARETREVRERMRLAELLLERGHAAQAETELSAIDSAAFSADMRQEAKRDPSVRWLNAEALDRSGRGEQAWLLVADPKDVDAAFGPWWATRGRWARARGDESTAATSFEEALAADPLEPQAACESAGGVATAPPLDPAQSRLCDAARGQGEPLFGGD